ncbi:MAG TPA: hypothetical protein DDZ81_19490 [Acetobacteraceae bacterium]|nr:hypothetical protein [Acetobacteraceae bacterium]
MAFHRDDGRHHLRDARAIFERELVPTRGNRPPHEITPDDHRPLCAKIVERGAPTTAIHARHIIKQIYGFAILHGEKVANPADEVGPASIATFVAKDRSLFSDRAAYHAQAA